MAVPILCLVALGLLLWVVLLKLELSHLREEQSRRQGRLENGRATGDNHGTAKGMRRYHIG